MSIGILILRLVVGLTLAAHGAQKLFGWFGGYGLTGAGVSAHAQKGFFAHSGGYEYTLILGIAALSLAFTGPGPLSLDAVLGVRDAGAGWGLAALVVGLAGAAL